MRAMRWLVHGTLDSAVAAALVRHGHRAQTIAETGISAGDPAAVLTEAHQRQLDVISDDEQLAAAPYQHRIRFDRCIVLIRVNGTDVEQDDAVDRLFGRYRAPAPGKLYTVTGSRVKVRQLPQGGN